MLHFSRARDHRQLSQTTSHFFSSWRRRRKEAKIDLLAAPESPVITAICAAATEECDRQAHFLGEGTKGEFHAALFHAARIRIWGQSVGPRSAAADERLHLNKERRDVSGRIIRKKDRCSRQSASQRPSALAGSSIRNHIHSCHEVIFHSEPSSPPHPFSVVSVAFIAWTFLKIHCSGTWQL